jgi:hypothetical protein
MAKKLKEITIPKEEAVFWMDKNGCWHNEHGKFQHKKIIDYFHACIKRDNQGYYLSQVSDAFREKVYFPHEDGAVFVFDVIKGGDTTLVLNTKARIKLRPKNLFIKDDSLYMSLRNEKIKFVEQALLKISDRLEYEGDEYFVRSGKRRYKIDIIR